VLHTLNLNTQKHNCGYVKSRKCLYLHKL